MRILKIEYVRLWGFIIAILTLAFQLKHLLSILLALEAGIISLFVLLFSLSNLNERLGYLALILITLSACEARLGLSILISMVRTRGNDYVSRFSIQKC